MKKISLTTQRMQLKGILDAGGDPVDKDDKKLLNKVKGRQKILDLDGGLSPEGEYLAEKGHDVVVLEEDGLVNRYRSGLFPNSKAAILNMNYNDLKIDFQYFDYVIIRHGLPDWFSHLGKKIIDLKEKRIVTVQKELDVLPAKVEQEESKDAADKKYNTEPAVSGGTVHYGVGCS